MGGGVARHTLQRPCRVDKLAYARIAVVKLLERLGQAQCLIQRHVQRGGHLLGNRVRLAIADVEGATHVAYGEAGGHRAEGHDLGDMIRAVFLRHIVDDLTAPPHAEVHVDIRHGDALRV